MQLNQSRLLDLFAQYFVVQRLQIFSRICARFPPRFAQKSPSQPHPSQLHRHGLVLAKLSSRIDFIIDLTERKTHGGKMKEIPDDFSFAKPMEGKFCAQPIRPHTRTCWGEGTGGVMHRRGQSSISILFTGRAVASMPRFGLCHADCV
jgi:hypothetical protein